MRYSPSAEEQASFKEMSLEERFHYATARMVESEEVWSLGDDNGWLIQERDDKDIITVWPYKDMAVECAVGTFDGNIPISVSLEHFIYGLLEQCQGNDIYLEVNPEAGKVGHIISAAQLRDVLEHMVESDTYFIEG